MCVDAADLAVGARAVVDVVDVVVLVVVGASFGIEMRSFVLDLVDILRSIDILWLARVPVVCVKELFVLALMTARKRLALFANVLLLRGWCCIVGAVLFWLFWMFWVCSC